MVIEVPYRSSQSANRSLCSFNQYRGSSSNSFDPIDDSALQPRIVSKGNNQRQLEINVPVNNYRPPDLKVSVRDNELIVQGEQQYNDQNRSQRSYFYKSTTLPRGTQVDQLQSRLNDSGQLTIEGPVF